MNVYDILIQVRNQLGDSIITNSDLLDDLFGLVNEKTSIYFDEQIVNRVGEVFELNYIPNTSTLDVFNIVGSTKEKIGSHVLTSSGLDIGDNLANLKSGIKLTIDDCARTVREAECINMFVHDISTQALNAGYIVKADLLSLVESYKLNSEDVLSIKSYLMGYLSDDKIAGIDIATMVQNLFYKPLSQDLTEGTDGNIELIATRAYVKGFMQCVLDIFNATTVLQIIGGILMLIPRAITTAIGVIINSIGAIIQTVSNLAFHYGYNDRGVVPSLDVPLCIDSDVYSTTPEFLGLDSEHRVCVFTTDTSYYFAILTENNSVSLNIFPLINIDPKKFSDRFSSMVKGAGDAINGRYYIDIEDQENLISLIHDNIDDIKLDVGIEQLRFMDPQESDTIILFNILLFLFSHSIMRVFDYSDSTKLDTLPYGRWSSVSSFDNIYSNSSNNTLGHAALSFQTALISMIKDYNSYKTIGDYSGINLANLLNYYQDLASNKVIADYYCSEGGYNHHYTVVYRVAENAAHYEEEVFTDEGYLNDIDYNHDLIPRDVFQYTLPEYDRADLIKGVLATVAGAAAIFTVYTIAKVKFTKWKFGYSMRKANEISSLKEDYLDNPTPENLAKMYKATRKYNRIAKLIGIPTYDTINEWFDYPEDGSSNDNSYLKGFDDLHKLICGV